MAPRGVATRRPTTMSSNRPYPAGRLAGRAGGGEPADGGALEGLRHVAEGEAVRGEQAFRVGRAHARPAKRRCARSGRGRPARRAGTGPARSTATLPPRSAVTPPTTEVPPPKGTTPMPRSAHTVSTCCTCAGSAGMTTASGAAIGPAPAMPNQIHIGQSTGTSRARIVVDRSTCSVPTTVGQRFPARDRWQFGRRWHAHEAGTTGVEVGRRPVRSASQRSACAGRVARSSVHRSRRVWEITRSPVQCYT